MEKKLIQVIGSASAGKTVAIGSFYNELIGEGHGINLSVKLPEQIIEGGSIALSEEMRKNLRRRTQNTDGFINVTTLSEYARRLFKPTVNERSKMTASESTGHNLFGKECYTMRNLIQPTSKHDGDGVEYSTFRFLHDFNDIEYVPYCEIRAYDYPGGSLSTILGPESESEIVNAYNEYDLAGFIVIVPTFVSHGEYSNSINSQLDRLNSFIDSLRECIEYGTIKNLSPDFDRLPLVFLMTRFDSTFLLSENDDVNGVKDLFTQRKLVIETKLDEMKRNRVKRNITGWRGPQLFVPTAATSFRYITSDDYLNINSIKEGIEMATVGNDLTRIGNLPQCYDFYVTNEGNDYLKKDKPEDIIADTPKRGPDVDATREEDPFWDIQTLIPWFFNDSQLEPWNSLTAWLKILTKTLKTPDSVERLKESLEFYMESQMGICEPRSCHNREDNENA